MHFSAWKQFIVTRFQGVVCKVDCGVYMLLYYNKISLRPFHLFEKTFHSLLKLRQALYGLNLRGAENASQCIKAVFENDENKQYL